MNSVVIEHVNISELPEVWRARLGQPSGNRVTVRIEEESAVDENAVQSSHANPLFGLWRDREEMSDVAAWRYSSARNYFGQPGLIAVDSWL